MPFRSIPLGAADQLMTPIDLEVKKSKINRRGFVGRS